MQQEDTCVRIGMECRVVDATIQILQEGLKVTSALEMQRFGKGPPEAVKLELSLER